MKPLSRTPLLSIVVPAYNVEQFIADAIFSALTQTMSDLEVVVVDDGSTDRTAKIIAAIRDPRLRPIRQENRGLAGARNSGVRAARAPFVGFLDGDDLWEPNKAATQLAAFEADAHLVMTYSYSAYIDDRGVRTGEYLVSRLRRPTLRQMIRRNHVGNGSTPIIRTRELREAGLFNERLRSVEDYEMWCRLLHRHGDGAAFMVPEPATLYRVRTRSLSVNFGNFVRFGEMANALMREAMPEIPRWVMREGLANIYRIASRKAASAGCSREALRYLGRALRLAPWLPLSDPRVAPTLALIATGGRAQSALHGVLRAAFIGSTAAKRT